MQEDDAAALLVVVGCIPPLPPLPPPTSPLLLQFARELKSVNESEPVKRPPGEREEMSRKRFSTAYSSPLIYKALRHV